MIVRTVLLLTLGIVGLVGMGCQEFSSPTAPDPEFVTINLSGQCKAGTARVECEESSTTDPPGQISSVSFRLIDARTGTSLETQTLNGGCATAPVTPCEVIFSGLAIGRYEVRHTLLTKAGTPATTTYGPLEVN